MRTGLVELYVHGRGRGHGTRSRVLYDLLRAEGLRVRVSVGPGAVAAFDGVESVSSVASLLPTMRLDAISVLIQRLSLASRALSEERPICIISDGDLPGILHARRHNIPSIAVGHGLVFSHAKAPEGVSSLLWEREGLKSRLSSIGSNYQLAVNFVELEAAGPNAQVVRPRFSETLERRPTGEMRSVVCYFRDDNGREILRALVEMGAKPIVFSREDFSLTGVEVRKPGRAEFREALEEAEAVVSSAGSQLISECLMAGIPHYVFYKMKDTEQRLNAEMLNASGQGQGTAFEDSDYSGLKRFLSRIPEKHSEASWGDDVGTALIKLVRGLA